MLGGKLLNIGGGGVLDVDPSSLSSVCTVGCGLCFVNTELPTLTLFF